ncbi:GyrI-like domain-containing protein [Campylobacter pinnipediorum]|uniref:GyrI-like domain-containing protein n=1 Tax=Campylobacter pinnipediorum TaxID=1965231 RepID=UPI0009948E1F|nr:GyrI-like domain-containing protein [Campylobacter pinnipediorum]
MNEIIIKESFKIIGFKASTTNKDESDLKTSKIDKLWDNFFNNDLCSKSAVKYGVYFNYENKHFGKYDILVGTKHFEKETLDTIEIQKGKYLVF